MTRNITNKHQTKYRTNKTEIAQIWANLGTDTPLDIGTREKGERKWKKLAKQIKELDEEFFNLICPYGIDS